jgi:hypothetical protein
MKRIDATRETILSVNDFVEVISENGQSALIGKSALRIDGETVEVYGMFSNDAEAVEACILFEGGEGDLTRDALYPQLCESFGLENTGEWKYWQICGAFDEGTNVGKVIDTYNEYPSGYWNTGKFILATPEEMRMAEVRREEERKRREAELKEMGFAYCDGYATDAWYKGKHEYHHSHGRSFVMNAPTKKSKYPFKVGIELEVCANSQEDYDKITSLKSNWFFMERDSSLDSYGIEIITVPLRFEDASDPSFWKPFTAWLSKHAKSWTKSCCGLHVHIGNEVFKVADMDVDMLKAKLSYAYNYNIDNDPINKMVFGREYGYNASKCTTKSGDAVKTLGEITKKPSGLLKDKDVQDAIVDETKRKMRNDRYYDINYSGDKTTEFRKGRGSINCERIASIVMYCYLMIEWSKKEKWENILSVDKFRAYLVKHTPEAHPLCRFIGDDECEY